MKKFADPRSRRMHAPRMPFESLQVSELIVVMEFMVITHQYLMMMNDKIGDRENLWHRSFDNYIIHDVRSYSVCTCNVRTHVTVINVSCFVLLITCVNLVQEKYFQLTMMQVTGQIEFGKFSGTNSNASWINLATFFFIFVSSFSSCLLSHDVSFTEFNDVTVESLRKIIMQSPTSTCSLDPYPS